MKLNLITVVISTQPLVPLDDEPFGGVLPGDTGLAALSFDV